MASTVAALTDAPEHLQADLYKIAIRLRNFIGDEAAIMDDPKNLEEEKVDEKSQLLDDTLEHIQDLLRHLRRDRKTKDQFALRFLFEWKLIQREVLPLFTHISGQKPDELKDQISSLTFNIIKLLATMTLPVADSVEEKDSRAEHLRSIVSHFCNVDVLSAIRMILSTALSTPLAKRREEDQQLVELILTLVRNLLLVDDSPVTAWNVNHPISTTQQLHLYFSTRLVESGIGALLLNISDEVSALSNEQQRDRLRHLVNVSGASFSFDDEEEGGLASEEDDENEDKNDQPKPEDNDFIDDSEAPASKPITFSPPASPSSAAASAEDQDDAEAVLAPSSRRTSRKIVDDDDDDEEEEEENDTNEDEASTKDSTDPSTVAEEATEEVSKDQDAEAEEDEEADEEEEDEETRREERRRQIAAEEGGEEILEAGEGDDEDDEDEGSSRDRHPLEPLQQLNLNMILLEIFHLLFGRLQPEALILHPLRFQKAHPALPASHSGLDELLEREKQARQQRLSQLNAKTRHPRWGGTYSVSNILTGDRKTCNQQLSRLNGKEDDFGVELFRNVAKKPRAVARNHHAAVSSNNIGCVNSRPAAHLLQVAPIPQSSINALLKFAQDFATKGFQSTMEFMQLALNDQALAPNFYESDKAAVLWMIGFFGSIHRISVVEDENYRANASTLAKTRSLSLESANPAPAPLDIHLTKENQIPVTGCNSSSSSLSLSSSSSSSSLSLVDSSDPQTLDEIFADPPSATEDSTATDQMTEEQQAPQECEKQSVFEPLFVTFDEATFRWITKEIEDSFSSKNWMKLQSCILTLKSQIQLLETLLSRKIEESLNPSASHDQEKARKIFSRFIDDRDNFFIDWLPRLLKSYSPSQIALSSSYLEDLLELIYTTLRIMDSLAKEGEMLVKAGKSRRRQTIHLEDGTKKTIDTQRYEIFDESSIIKYVQLLIHPDAIRSLCYIIENFATNSNNTNHQLARFLYRVSHDLRFPYVFYRLTTLRVFDKLLNATTNKDQQTSMRQIPTSLTTPPPVSRQLQDLRSVVSFIIRQLVADLQADSQLYLELMFPKKWRQWIAAVPSAKNSRFVEIQVQKKKKKRSINLDALDSDDEREPGENEDYEIDDDDDDDVDVDEEDEDESVSLTVPQKEWTEQQDFALKVLWEQHQADEATKDRKFPLIAALLSEEEEIISDVQVARRLIELELLTDDLLKEDCPSLHEALHARPASLKRKSKAKRNKKTTKKTKAKRSRRQQKSAFSLLDGREEGLGSDDEEEEKEAELERQKTIEERRNEREKEQQTIRDDIEKRFESSDPLKLLGSEDDLTIPSEDSIRFFAIKLLRRFPIRRRSLRNAPSFSASDLFVFLQCHFERAADLLREPMSSGLSDDSSSDSSHLLIDFSISLGSLISQVDEETQTVIFKFLLNNLSTDADLQKLMESLFLIHNNNNNNRSDEDEGEEPVDDDDEEQKLKKWSLTFDPTKARSVTSQRLLKFKWVLKTAVIEEQKFDQRKQKALSDAFAKYDRQKRSTSSILFDEDEEEKAAETEKDDLEDEESEDDLDILRASSKKKKKKNNNRNKKNVPQKKKKATESRSAKKHAKRKKRQAEMAAKKTTENGTEDADEDDEGNESDEEYVRSVIAGNKRLRSQFMDEDEDEGEGQKDQSEGEDQDREDEENRLVNALPPGTPSAPPSKRHKKNGPSPSSSSKTKRKPTPHKPSAPPPASLELGPLLTQDISSFPTPSRHRSRNIVCEDEDE